MSEYVAARHISFGATFVDTFLVQAQFQGAHPDRMLERLHRNVDFMREAAQLAIRHLLPECEPPQLTDEPPDQTFGDPGTANEHDSFHRMLIKNFLLEENIDRWLPREGKREKCYPVIPFTHQPGKIPASGREFFAVELKNEIPLEELLEILKHLRWGLGFLYDLVRVRHYAHREPIFALGSHLRVGHSPTYEMQTDVLPCVTSHFVALVHPKPMFMRTLERCAGRTAIQKGWRLLLWRKKT